MSVYVHSTDLARCREKKARGNVFFSRQLAEDYAATVRHRSGDPVYAYECPCCHFWHVGKSRHHIGG